MTPSAFKKLNRKHIDALLSSSPTITVDWPNVAPEKRADSASHAEGYFQNATGGLSSYGGQARRERYDWILFVAVRVPLGTADDDADAFVWRILRGYDSDSEPAGVRVGNKRLRRDGEIRGMYQVTAVVELSHDYQETEG